MSHPGLMVSYHQHSKILFVSLNIASSNPMPKTCHSPKL